MLVKAIEMPLQVRESVCVGQYNVNAGKRFQEIHLRLVTMVVLERVCGESRHC